MSESVDAPVGVIGLGNIGVTVVADLLLRGLQVVGVDSHPERLEAVRAEVLPALRYGPALKKTLPRVDAQQALERLHLTGDLSRIAGCEVVIENIPERWEAKEALYRQMGPVLSRTALVAANTSCISITRLAALLPEPQRVLGMHFMNPAWMTEGVEVIAGFHTSEPALQRARELVRRLGKEPIVVQDLPGFASNRVSHLFMNEAAWVVHDGVADAASVDALFRKGFGHKMGPLETADLIGLDTVVNTLDLLLEAHGDPKYRCCPLLRKMVHAGLLGRKSGRGFHSY
jgi:3-hydroxybutyryl-CoA dehydrogenase